MHHTDLIFTSVALVCSQVRQAWWGALIYAIHSRMQHFNNYMFDRPAFTLGPMFTHDTQLRVRYGETDQMGYVYYGNYAMYFEVGRVEALRTLGFAYRKLEEEGIMLPVRSLNITYHAPAFYDDLITIRTAIAEMPTARIRFTYHIYNEAGALLTEAETVLVFVDKQTMRPRKAPSAFYEAMKNYFS